ncbi:Synaptotagmin 14 [Carabus blaptoides fortunei]
MISGSEYANSVRNDGSAFLGAIAGFAALLLVFLLYLNKRWWWGAVSGLACCDEPCPSPPIRPPTPASGTASSAPVQTGTVNKAHSKNKLGKTFSFDGGDSSSETESMASTAKATTTNPQQMSCFYQPARRPSQDLISLVEKGKVAVSSNSSCCSSTTSSVGDRHGTVYINAQGHPHTVSHRITTHDIRETKIDNYGDYGNDFQTVKTEKTTEEMDINSNRDCIVVMNSEPFESSDLQSCVGSETDTQLVNKCGHLEIALLYDAPMRKMTVHVLQARDIPSRDRGQPTHTQVRLLMLPSKKQKHKTKIRSGDNPQYMESFLLHKVNPEDVNSMGLRLRVYGCERMRRERLIGEAVVSFAHINLELENNLWLSLEPRTNTALNGCTGELMSLARSDSTSSTHSMQHGGVPELLLGLAYNATTGRLSIEVVKGSHFRNLAMNRAPDTYVKMSLVSSTGQELAHSKTSVRRGQPNPLFKETFMFQVALFQLADVTLMVSVYNRKGVTKRKEMIGWFSLGLNSSGAEELAHWMDMKDMHQEQLCRWHILVDS